MSYFSEFREWLNYKKLIDNDDNDSINFWYVIRKDGKYLPKISNIRVQGSIYHALSTFFDIFEKNGLPFLQKTIIQLESLYPFKTKKHYEHYEHYEYIITNISNLLLCNEDLQLINI